MNINPALLMMILFFLAFSGFLVFCYVAARYADCMESYLPTSHYMRGNKKRFSEMGLVGKVLRAGAISVVLTAPKLFVRKGVVNMKEIDAFPWRMKWCLIFLWNGWVALYFVLVFVAFIAEV